MNSRIIRALIVFIAVFFTGTSLWAFCTPRITIQNENHYWDVVIKLVKFTTGNNGDGSTNPGGAEVSVVFSNNNPQGCLSWTHLTTSLAAEMTPYVYRSLFYQSKLIETLVFAQQKNIPVAEIRTTAGEDNTILRSVILSSPQGAAPPPEQGQQQGGQGGQQGQQGQQDQHQCPQDRSFYCETDQQCHVTQADCPAR